MSRPVTEQRALVTGGTRGIGRAISLALAERGCRVLATGVCEDEVSAFRAHAEGREGVDASVLDVRDPARVDEVIASCERLDILVCAAGTILRENREHDPVAFSQVVDVNLNGAMRVCAAARAKLAETRGCVVNIASMLSFFGSGTQPAYSASKGGLLQLTRSLAIAWAPEGIRVNAVAPGWIETDLTAPLRADAEKSRRILERTPLGRWGLPEDVAGAVLFLASPAAAFITGVVLPVDGGYSAS